MGYVYGPAFIAIGVCSVLTAPLGAKLAHRLPAAKLKTLFFCVTVCVSVETVIFLSAERVLVDKDVDSISRVNLCDGQIGTCAPFGDFSLFSSTGN
nr:sulfite exporter TauE/SafE family protein [Methylocucumis oryzae]